uniref:Uncharacterized protein n=1 Tax=Romanomermis culicivorax TaxID=13658 RepID=A0A915IDI6_ROMCU
MSSHRCNSPQSLKRRSLQAKQNRNAIGQIIQEFRKIKNSSKQLTDCQRRASENLLKWSLGENNRAIKDMTFQFDNYMILAALPEYMEDGSYVEDFELMFNELICLWGDVQTECSHKIYETIKQMDIVADTYKALHDAEQKVEKFSEAERKLKQDLKAARRWRKGGDIRIIEEKVTAASKARQAAEKNFADILIEQEAIKMLQYKNILVKVAEIFLHSAANCASIFEAQHDIALNAPDPAMGDNLRDLRYSPQYSQQRVEIARHELAQMNLSSDVASVNQNRRRVSGYSVSTNSASSTSYASRLSSNGNYFSPPRRSNESTASGAGCLLLDPPPSYEDSRRQAQEAILS